MRNVSSASRWLLPCLLLFFGTLAASAQRSGPRQGLPLKAALQKIRSHYNAHFVYDEDQLQGKTTYADLGQMKTHSIEDMLKAVLYPNGLVFLYIKANYYTIVPKDRVGTVTPAQAPAAAGQPAAEARTIIGRIVDVSGRPLPDVTVTALNGRSPAADFSDPQGGYSIRLPEGASQLRFTSLGYRSQTLAIGAGDVMDITLSVEIKDLSEVVVVGYGEQKKTKLTSAISTVSGKELATVPLPNISQSLAGRVSGLIAYNTTGLPGLDDATLLVRGLSTTGNNSPLIVIDGIPRASFSHLDPNDIATFSILKDASAVAVYGARAANGAILITTRRGSYGAPTMTYSGNAGFQKAVFLGPQLDSYTTAKLWNEAWQNEGKFNPSASGVNGWPDSILQMIKNHSNPDLYSNTNWVKTIMGGKALLTQHDLSISGGSDKIRYFISGGYSDQDGLFPASNFKRYNIRSNIDGSITRNLDFALSLAGRIEAYANSVASPSSSAILIPSLEPIRYTNGTYHYSLASAGNPYLTSRGAGGYSRITNNILENALSLTYHIPGVQGLSVKGNLAFDKAFDFQKTFTEPYLSYVLNSNGTYTGRYNTITPSGAILLENYTQIQSITAEASVNYARTFGKHSFSGLLLYTQTQTSTDTLGLTKNNFPSTVLDQLNYGSTVSATEGAGTQIGLMGVVGRATYDYAGKYMGEFSWRYDGSDIFPPGHRFGFFPAVSAGWRISEEKFMKRYAFVNNLKLRGSWGRVGNNRVGQFSYLSTYSIPNSNGYPFGGAAAADGQQELTPGVIANSAFTWERANITDAGLETTLWKGLLGAEVDYFYKRTDHILGTRSSQIPALIGGTLPSENLAIVTNSGWDLTLSHQNTIGKFQYGLRATFTFNTSKVIYTPEAAGLPQGQRLTGRVVSSGSATGYKAQGLYQSQDEINQGPVPLYGLAATHPGDIRYADINHDGKIDANDAVIITRGPVPNIVYGLDATAGYKNFELSLFFQGDARAQVLLPVPIANSFYNSNMSAYPYMLDRWTPAHTNASFPRLTVTSQNNRANSTYWVRNGAYGRLKNAQLSYRLPAAPLKRIGMQGATFFVNGSNLLTFSPLKKIIDPESSLSAGIYPLVKVFNAGVSLNF